MKKQVLTLAIVLGLGTTAFAGGLFQRNINAENGKSGYVLYDTRGDFYTKDAAAPLLPAHGEFDDQAAPLGSGVALLLGLGTAYLVGKRRKE